MVRKPDAPNREGIRKPVRGKAALPRTVFWGFCMAADLLPAIAAVTGEPPVSAVIVFDGLFLLSLWRFCANLRQYRLYRDTCRAARPSDPEPAPKRRTCGTLDEYRAECERKKRLRAELAAQEDPAARFEPPETPRVRNAERRKNAAENLPFVLAVLSLPVFTVVGAIFGLAGEYTRKRRR
ncbi:MAG: hypothetical protein ACI4QB_08485 [Eubacteriales bacterium]